MYFVWIIYLENIYSTSTKSNTLVQNTKYIKIHSRKNRISFSPMKTTVAPSSATPSQTRLSLHQMTSWTRPSPVLRCALSHIASPPRTLRPNRSGSSGRPASCRSRTSCSSRRPLGYSTPRSRTRRASSCSGPDPWLCAWCRRTWRRARGSAPRSYRRTGSRRRGWWRCGGEAPAPRLFLWSVGPCRGWGQPKESWESWEQRLLPFVLEADTCKLE